jgi:drug/metabolite transporter (DMT)-like permease
MNLFSQRKNKAKAVFLTILAGVLWGTSFPVIKIGLNYVDSYMFVFLRFLFASALMFLIMLLTRKLSFPKKGQKKLIVFLGLANGIGYLLQYIGMNYTSAAKAALFINLSAIWVAILSPKLLGEDLERKKILGVIAGLIGVLLVTSNLNFSMFKEWQLIGDALLIFSGVTWAFFMIYNKPLATSGNSLISSLTWILPSTLLPMIPFIFFSTGNITNLPIEAWLAISYTAVVCWIIPYYLWLEGLKHISASTSTVLLLSEVVVAMAISFVLLNESLTLISAVGAFFIVTAILLVSYRSS